MKKKSWLLTLSFGAGLLSGMLLHVGLVTFQGRAGGFGGEMLILPMIAVLVYLGWELGQAKRMIEDEQRGYRRGYRAGKAAVRCVASWHQPSTAQPTAPQGTHEAKLNPSTPISGTE